LARTLVWDLALSRKVGPLARSPLLPQKAGGTLAPSRPKRSERLGKVASYAVIEIHRYRERSDARVAKRNERGSTPEEPRGLDTLERVPRDEEWRLPKQPKRSHDGEVKAGSINAHGDAEAIEDQSRDFDCLRHVSPVGFSVVA
jgi:hypothetical protein